MRIIRYISLFCFLFMAGSVSGQTEAGYATFLSDVASRSPQLIAAQKGNTATLLGLRTGLAPDDPEVGFEYYFVGETKCEIAIEQTFDFPTVYHQRNKISKLGISRAEQVYRSARRSVMATVSDAYLDLNYATKRMAIITKRRDELQRVVTLYKEGIKVGGNTIIELRNVEMLLVEIETNLILIETERVEAVAILQQLNGGQKIAPEGYPQFDFTGDRDEFLNAALAADYELQAVAIDTLIAQRELKLRRNEWIPKLKIGYKIELEGTQATNALLAGISLPLWQNSGRTRHAKALGDAAQAQHVATEAATRVRLASLYARYQSLSAVLSSCIMSRTGDDYPSLLMSSAEAGQITSIDAILSISEWYALQDTLMALEYEVAIAGSAMALCLM